MNIGPAPGGDPQATERVRAAYRSPAREAKAADTRRRITVAALALFTEQGFPGTTVAAIAASAGVAVQTVYAAFGTKAAIVQSLLEQLEEDAGARTWRERIAAEPRPDRKLRAFAEWSAGMYAASRATIAAARGAANDPAIARLKERGDQHRREALQVLVESLAGANALRAGLAVTDAVDRAWMLTGIELYFAAGDGCGWSDTRYAEWLGELLVGQLLGVEARTDTHGRKERG